MARPLPNLPANSMARNHPRGFLHHCPNGYLSVSTAFILVYVVFMLFHFFLSSHLLSHLQVDFDAPRRTEPFASGGAFHAPDAFEVEYAKMEKELKVFVYPEGDSETYFHTPRKLTGKYASEGYFFKNIRESTFLTTDPDQAHLFFIPISCHKMRGKVCSICNKHFDLSVTS